MKPMLALLSVFFCDFSTQAQYLQKTQDPITLQSDYDQTKDELVVQVTKRVLGNYSIAVEFVSPRNLMPPAHFRTSVKSSGTLIRVKPTQVGQPVWCSFRFAYILGMNDARVDHGFVYRLPFSAHRGGVRADTAFNISVEYFKDARPKNWTAYYFRLQPGDTIYAARKGRVVALEDQYDTLPGAEYTSRSNYIRVEHADGSIANYQVLERGSLMVEDGQTVYPDTPLARVGSFDGKIYKLAFFVYYIENAPLKQGNQYDVTKAFESSFVDPVFATDQGDIKLLSGQTYQARADEALLSAEMNKRELKKRELP